MASPIFTTSIQPPPRNTKLVLPTQIPNTNPPVFNDAMKIRMDVFVDEQKFSAGAEIDTDDARSWHWVWYSGTTPVGTIRLVPPQVPYDHAEFQGAAHEPSIKLTRVAIMPAYRGVGLGRRLVETTLEWAAVHAAEIDEAWVAARGEAAPWRGLVLVHAQLQVQGMYARVGFEVNEKLARWDEEGVEHLEMFRRIEIKT